MVLRLQSRKDWDIIAGIRRTLRLGRAFQLEHPDIGERYQQGHTYDGIVDDLNLTDHSYVLHPQQANRGVGFAIWGSKGFYGIRSYKGLLDRLLLPELRQAHQRANGKHARDAGIGIFSLEGEAFSEAAREAAYASVAARGQIPWTEEERRFLYEQSLRPENRRGPRNNIRDLVKLQTVVNDAFRNGRTKATINTMLHLYEKEILASQTH